MSRGGVPSAERMRRLLVILPWVIERGEVSVGEVSARFGLKPSDVVADLERASMCGVPPYGPEDLVDLYIDEDTIYCGQNRLFTRPVRLTAPEAFAVLAAGEMAQQLPGAQPGPLSTALEKIERAVGESHLDIDVRRPRHLDAVARAVDTHREIDFTYESASDSGVQRRCLRPTRVFSDRGLWYVDGIDATLGSRRTFRVDRLDDVVVSERSFAPARSASSPASAAGSTDGTPAWFADDPDISRATLVLSPRGRWIVERYPCDTVESLADGTVRVTLPVTNERWLAVLLMRAGSDAVVESPEAWRDLGRNAARALLERYSPM